MVTKFQRNKPPNVEEVEAIPARKQTHNNLNKWFSKLPLEMKRRIYFWEFDYAKDEK